MLPRVILHNSVTLDGSFVNFEPHMGLHYRIAGQYRPQAHLIGSNTIKMGIELYGQGVPEEEDTDFVKPKRDEGLPYWVIVDTKGTCKGILHTCRRFEFCRDVIVLTSEETPQDYVVHLKERNYTLHTAGQKHVDLKELLRLLEEKYSIKTVLADTGRTLGNLLLDQGLVSEISLLVHPVIAGKKGENLFDHIENELKLKLFKTEILDEDFIWLVYRIT